MRIIVTHHSPDLDGITSIWLIKKFLPGWEEAKIRFIPAGERIGNVKFQMSNTTNNPIERIGNDEIIHVDTGLGPLDHHQIPSDKVSAASLTFDFVKRTTNNQPFDYTQGRQLTANKEKTEAIARIIQVVVEIDHFKECLWADPLADYHEFSLPGVLEGLKRQFPGKDRLYLELILKCLDAILHQFENRIWAEKELKKGIRFRVKGKRGIGFESINDAILSLAQKKGFKIVLRKDPRKGYVRIKVRPDTDIDLTPVYNKLKKLDSGATWFLHVSQKMLLNGTTKNPRMKATKLSLEEIIKILEEL